METKLDSKFAQNRQNIMEVNRSLPTIHVKPRLGSGMHGQKEGTHAIKIDKKSNKLSTIDTKYDRMIMDELRNISLVSKNKKLK